jgi:hypothetical protein
MVTYQLSALRALDLQPNLVDDFPEMDIRNIDPYAFNSHLEWSLDSRRLVRITDKPRSYRLVHSIYISIHRRNRPEQ